MELESEIFQSIQQIDADFGVDVTQIFVALQDHWQNNGKLGLNSQQFDVFCGSQTFQYEFLARWVNIFTTSSRFVGHFVRVVADQCTVLFKLFPYWT